MRRHGKIEAQPQEWEIIVDCPMDGNVTDRSGKGKDLDLISGTVSYVQVNNETWANLRNCVLRFDNPTPSEYINNFRFEIDFYRLASSPTTCQIVDSMIGVGGQAIKVGSNWGSNLAVGINKYNGNNERDDTSTGVYGVVTAWSNISLNIPYRAIIQNYQGIVYAAIINLQTSQILVDNNMTAPTLDPPNPYALLGKSYYASNLRYWNGYVRNLKLYKHV